MTPTALILALTIVVLPPDPTTGTDGPVRGSQATIGGQGGHGGDNNYRVLAGVAGSIIPGGGRNDGTPGTLAQQHVPLYVHALDRPAVDVDGLDPQFLAESVSVVKCESTHREGAVNPTSGTRGLLQIHPIHIKRIERLGYTWDDMLSAGPNLHVAASIHAEQGWGPWSCRHTPVPVVGTDAE